MQKREVSAAAGQVGEIYRREEMIKRKKKESVNVVFYENDHGVLEGNPYEEGCYIATRGRHHYPALLPITVP